MMSNQKEYQLRGYKNLLAIAVIALCVYFGFSPLFEYIGGGVEGAIIGASFGAIFVIVLTMYLLNKQTEIEQESKRGEKVFEEKVRFYKSLLTTSRGILVDGRIDAEEIKQLSFLMVELQMLGTDETIQAFLKVLEKCNDVYHATDDDVVELSDEDTIDLLTSLSKFSQECRVDLGIGDVELDKTIFNTAVAQIREGVTRKVGNKEYFDTLDAKIEQLKALGCNEDGIKSYQILVKFFNDKAINDDRYRMAMAKGGGGFYYEKKPQIYLNNPGKRSAGIGIDWSGGGSREIVDQTRDYVLGLLGKEQSKNVSAGTGMYKHKPTPYAVRLQPGLAEEMDIPQYHEMLGEIANRIYKACENRSTD